MDTGTHRNPADLESAIFGLQVWPTGLSTTLKLEANASESGGEQEQGARRPEGDRLGGASSSMTSLVVGDDDEAGTSNRTSLPMAMATTASGETRDKIITHPAGLR